jgi:hypothetical protein
MFHFIAILIYCCFYCGVLAQDLSKKEILDTAKRPVAKESAKGSESNEKSIDFWVLNFGTHTEYFNSVQNNASGGLRQFDFAPTIGGGAHIPLSRFNLTFLPEVNWVLPRTSESTKIIKNLFMFRADLGYEALDWLRLRLGTSLMWLNQHGRGGSTQVSNGNGSSTFYYPDENHSSINNTLDFGIEGMIDSHWSVRLQTYIYSIFIAERRQVSYSIFVSYYWDR